MDSVLYTESILKDTLLPFITAKFGEDGHRFQQDNDPKHTSKLTKKFMADNNINWWNEWPAGILITNSFIIDYKCTCSLTIK